MKRVWSVLGPLAVVFAAIVLAEVPPFPALAAWIESRAVPFLIGAGAVLAIGLVLFFGGIFRLAQLRGRELSHAEAENVERSVRIQPQPVAWGASTYRIIGSASGVEASDEFKLRELKSAWRRGEVWNDPQWRRRIATVSGALLAIAGGGGIGVVLGPPWVKVLLGAGVVFIFARLAIAWQRIDTLGE